MINEIKQKLVQYEVFQEFSEFADEGGYTIGRSLVNSSCNLRHLSLFFKVGADPVDVLQALKSLENRIKSEIAKGYEYETYGKYIEPTEDPKGNS